MGKKRGRPSKADADTTTNDDAAQSANLNGEISEPASQPAETSAPEPAEATPDAGETSKVKKSKKQKTSAEDAISANGAETTVDQEDVSVDANVSTKKKKKKEKRDKNNIASEINGDAILKGSQDAAQQASADAGEVEKKKRKKKRKHAEMDEAETSAQAAGTGETAADASQADEAAPKKKRKKSKRKSGINEDADVTAPNDIEGAPVGESQAETDAMAPDETTTATQTGEKKKKSKGDKKEKKEKKSKKKSKEQATEADASVEAFPETGAAVVDIPPTQDAPAQETASGSPAKTKSKKKDKGKGKQVDNTEAEQPAEATAAAVADDDENFELPPPLSQPKPTKGRKSNVITPIAPGDMFTPVAAAPTKRPTRSTKVAPPSLFNDLPGHPEASTSTAAATRSSTAKKGPAPKLSTQKTIGGTVRLGALPDLAPAKKTPAPRTAKASSGAKGSAKKGPSTPALDSEKVAEMLHVKDGVVPILPPSLNSEEYQETLATKWLAPKEIAALVEEGMRIRSGKYSNEEDAVIKSNINSYRRRKDMSEVEVVEAIISKDKEVRKQHHIFWTDLARALHDRPLMSIYHHVTRLLAPTARQGSWSKEEDAKLKAAVDQHGQKWEDIALEVGRWSGDCRDRWRNYISAGDTKAVGKWTQAEEDKLRECVRRVKEANEAYGNVDAGDTEIFWTSVAKAFGGTRTRHQCRIKWTDNMANKILTKDGDKVRWSRRDAFIFITKLASLGLKREDDVEWGLLPDPDWNWWSGHTLQRRWATLRTQARTALDDPKATFPEMVKWLKEKQDAIPREEVKAFMSVKPGEQGESDVDGEEEQEATPAPKKAPAKKKTPVASASNARASAKKVLSKEFVSESEESAGSDGDEAESE